MTNEIAQSVRTLLTGILPPITMPFDTEGNLVPDGLKPQIDLMIAHGVRAILAYVPKRGCVEKNHGTGATTRVHTRPLPNNSRNRVSTNMPCPGLTELGYRLENRSVRITGATFIPPMQTRRAHNTNRQSFITPTRPVWRKARA